jgi:pimeloyl-ACP methyl ester carboxylesterase
MKKLVCLFLLSFITWSIAWSQDLEKISRDFQQAMNDTVTAYGKNKKAGKYYDVRGIKMYCEIYGQGEPLLLIHGNSGSINNFAWQIPYFSKKYKVIVADSRAQGNSKDIGDSLTYEMMADDYAALLDQLKIDSAYVVGWSDGGINGLLLAMRHPKKVKKLAVTGANLVPDTTAVPQMIWDMVLPELNRLRNKEGKTEREKNALKLFKLLGEEPHIQVSDLRKIQCPALVIGGDHDVIKEEHTMLIYKNIPKSYLWILPASGHSTPVVYKDEFNNTVDRFLQTPYRTFNGEARFF